MAVGMIWSGCRHAHKRKWQTSKYTRDAPCARCEAGAGTRTGENGKLARLRRVRRVGVQWEDLVNVCSSIHPGQGLESVAVVAGQQVRQGGAGVGLF